MNENLIRILERLCEASDDVVYAELRGMGDDVKNASDEFDSAWNEAIEKLEVKE